MMKKSRRVAAALAVAALAAVAVVYARTGPYVFPATWALGACFKDWTSPESYARRASPLRSADATVAGFAVRVCYGAPSARGRELFGEASTALAPFGEYWRTGANEPTRLFTADALDFGGMLVPAGRYSLYTVPGPEQWQVVLNHSTFHWGSDFGAGVTRHEAGRVAAVAEESGEFVETFRVRFEPRGADGVEMRLEWGAVSVPVELRAGETDG